MTRNSENASRIWTDISLVSKSNKNNAEQFLTEVLDEMKNRTNNPVKDLEDALKFANDLNQQILSGHEAHKILSQIGWVAKGNLGEYQNPSGRIRKANFVVVPKEQPIASVGRDYNFDVLYGDIQGQDPSGMYYASVKTLTEADSVLLGFFKSLNIRHKNKLKDGTIQETFPSGATFRLDSIGFKIATHCSQRGDVKRLQGYLEYVLIPSLTRELETERSREERLRTYYNTPGNSSSYNEPNESVNVTAIEVDDTPDISYLMDDDDTDDFGPPRHAPVYAKNEAASEPEQIKTVEPEPETNPVFSGAAETEEPESESVDEAEVEEAEDTAPDYDSDDFITSQPVFSSETPAQESSDVDPYSFNDDAMSDISGFFDEDDKKEEK